MAGDDVARGLFFETRRNLTTEAGRQGAPPGKDAAVDPLLEAGHLPRNSASRLVAPVREEPSFGTAPSRPCV